MLKLILWHDSDPCILVNGTIIAAVNSEEAPDKNNKQVIFKICAQIIDCIEEINSTQVDNIKDFDAAMLL